MPVLALSCSGLSGSYEEPVRDYFEEYTETAAIGRMENPNKTARDSSAIDCITSDGDKTLIFYMRNPKKYRLNVQFLCDPDESTVEPAQVQLVQNDGERTILRLTYRQSFLLEHEGGLPIGGTITLQESTTLRSFNSFSYKLKCNSPPPAVKGLLMQNAPKESGSGQEYILCFFMPTDLLASPTHNMDTHYLHINDVKLEVGSSEYNSLLSTAEPSGLEPSIENGPAFDASRAPSGYSAMYYRTGISITDASITYDMLITDDDDLSSAKAACNNKTEKLEVPVLKKMDGTVIAENTSTAPLELFLDDDTGAADLNLFAPAETTSGSSVGDVTVRYTISKISGDETVTEKSARGNARVQIFKCGSYKITAFAEKSRYMESESVSRYVKVKRTPYIYVAENASVADGNGTKAKPFKGITQAAEAIDELDDDSSRSIYIYVKGSVKGSGTISSTVNTAKGEKIYIQNAPGTTSAILDGNNSGSTLTIETSVPITIKDVQITGANKAGYNAGLAMSSGTDVTLLSGVVIGKICSSIPAGQSECANKGYGICNEGGKLTINGATISGNGTGILVGEDIDGENLTMIGGCINYNLNRGLYTYGGCKAKLSNVQICGNKTQYAGGGILFEDGSNSLELTGCTIKDNSAKQGGGIYCFGTSVTLKNCTVQGNSATDGGGGIWIQELDELALEGSTTLTGNTSTSGFGAVQTDAYLGAFFIGGNTYIPYGGAKGKNDIYINDPITITNSLQRHSASDRMQIIPNEYAVGTPLLIAAEGLTLSNEISKFNLAQPIDGYNIFCISSVGRISTHAAFFNFINGVEDGSSQKNPANYKNYDVVKYSCLTYDNLKISVANPYASSGFTMNVQVDSESPTPAPISEKVLEDGFHTLTIMLTKPGEVEFSIQKLLSVRIKPVKVQISGKLHGWYRVSPEEIPCAQQTFHLQAGNPYDEYPEERSFTLTYDESGSRDGDHACNYYWWTPADKNYVWMTSKSSNFYFWADQAYDCYTERYMGKFDKGCDETTRTLADLKSDKHFDSQDRDGNGNITGGAWDRSRVWIDVSLSDSTDP